MFFKKWFKQKKLKKLERKLAEAKSCLAVFKSVSSSGADGCLTWRAWPAEAFYGKEVDRLEAEIRLL